jgi:ubiquinone/menaquinone biosynthesis C-methylase UbiE
MRAQLSSSIDYHLSELAIVEVDTDPRRLVPTAIESERDVLDIGCGIGQTLMARELRTARLRVGIDIDRAAINFGQGRFPELGLLVASAEKLPFQSRSFDLVVSRVALPYTNIPAVLRECRRVLRAGGRFWAVLHESRIEIDRFRSAAANGSWKSILDSFYVWTNSAYLHTCGRSLPRPWSGRHESFQTRSGMHRMLESAGFVDPDLTAGCPFVVTARVPMGTSTPTRESLST